MNGKRKQFIEKMEQWKNQPSIVKLLCQGKRSLTSKMIMLFFIVIFPINMIMVVITNFVTQSYEQRISESYSYQLRIYGQVLENQFTSMQQDMNDFLRIDNLVILTHGSLSDSTLDMVRFNKELAGSDAWNTYPGLYYVWDKEKDVMGFSNMNQKYSSKIREELERLIRERMGETARNQEDILIYGNEAFLLKRYDYDFFSLGILYDVRQILKQFYSEEKNPVGSIYLANEDGEILVGYNEEAGLFCEEVQQNISDWNEKTQLVVCQSLGFGNLQLVHSSLRIEYMKDLRTIIWILYILCGISFVAIPLLCLFIMHWVSNPVKKLCLAMEEVEGGNLRYLLEGEAGTYQMDYLFHSFNHMVEELNLMVNESYVKEIEKLQTDSINIRLQVNQHMLLNFLNTIYSLSCAGKTEQVNEFTSLLMNYFRYVLRQDIGLVTVGEEMQFVQDYLKLQKIRFPNSFHFVYSVEDGAEKLKIPQLLIENFVENIIKYGLVMGREIEILINVRIEDDKLIVSICDTGNGMEKERAQKLQNGEIVEDQNGKHIGIWNCKRRLKYYYGESHAMTISSQPGGGTQIWMEMLKQPLEQETAAKKIRQMDRRES